jgi:P-type conjugative transfer protein TrbG
MRKLVSIFVSAAISSILLSGCMNTVKYNPDDFVTPDRVVEKKVPVPVLPSVNATYGIGNDPAVIKAYNLYQKTGKMMTIRSQGWVTYPYSPESKPIISCSTNRFCIVQLESGEKLNSYGLSDTQDWMTNAFVTGEGPDASVSIQTKPKADGISADLTISTNKRTYLIGLVAKPNADTTVLRFYYPEDTMIANLQQANKVQQQGSDSQVVDSTSLNNGTAIKISDVTFNYKINCNGVSWCPLRAFDDKNKTYIEMPGIVSRMSLPVLYLAKDKEMQLINYRYEAPYFIVDGLFAHAWLVSGKGSDQERVEIINKNL